MEWHRARGCRPLEGFEPDRPGSGKLAAVGACERKRVSPRSAPGVRLRPGQGGAERTEDLRADAEVQPPGDLLGGPRRRARASSVERDGPHPAARDRCVTDGGSARSDGAQRRFRRCSDRLLGCQIHLVVHPSVAARLRPEAAVRAAEPPELSGRAWLSVDGGCDGAGWRVPATIASGCWALARKPPKRASGLASTTASTSTRARRSAARSASACCNARLPRGRTKPAPSSLRRLRSRQPPTPEADRVAS